MFSERVPLGSLIQFCRSLRHQMEAGLTLGQAVKQQGKKGSPGVRPVAARMAAKLNKGESFAVALQEERDHFPPLFLTLSAVAENTGHIPEVLRDLEDHFTMQQRLWKQFLGLIAWPAFQLCAAVGVIGLLIWIMGIIADMNGTKPFITIFGLSGATGALMWFVCVVGFFALLFGSYFFIRNVMSRGAGIDRFLLGVPAVGGCMREFALSRFSMGMGLTMEAGTPIGEACRLSLRATNNRAYEAEGEKAEEKLRNGYTLHDTLKETNLFPEEYLVSVENAEETGQEPEVFRKQAEIHNEEAGRALRRLTVTAGILIWVLIAAMIIFFIFYIAMQYVGFINKMVDNPLGP